MPEDGVVEVPTTVELDGRLHLHDRRHVPLLGGIREFLGREVKVGHVAGSKSASVRGKYVGVGWWLDELWHGAARRGAEAALAACGFRCGGSEFPSYVLWCFEW